MTDNIYNAVYHGWSKKHVFSKKILHQQEGEVRSWLKEQSADKLWHTKDKHGHIMEHVRQIITKIDSGMIEKPVSPDMPEADERPGVTLGQRTKTRGP